MGAFCLEPLAGTSLFSGTAVALGIQLTRHHLPMSPRRHALASAGVYTAPVMRTINNYIFGVCAVLFSLQQSLHPSFCPYLTH